MSPYLFTMEMEVMVCKIRQEDKIKGMRIEDETVNELQYAGDTNGILQDKGSARHFLRHSASIWTRIQVCVSTQQN